MHRCNSSAEHRSQACVKIADILRMTHISNFILSEEGKTGHFILKAHSGGQLSQTPVAGSELHILHRAPF